MIAKVPVESKWQSNAEPDKFQYAFVFEHNAHFVTCFNTNQDPRTVTAAKRLACENSGGQGAKLQLLRKRCLKGEFAFFMVLSNSSQLLQLYLSNVGVVSWSLTDNHISVQKEKKIRCHLLTSCIKRKIYKLGIFTGHGGAVTAKKWT